MNKKNYFYIATWYIVLLVIIALLFIPSNAVITPPDTVLPPPTTSTSKTLTEGKNINLIENATNITIDALADTVITTSDITLTKSNNLVLVSAVTGNRIITLPVTTGNEGHILMIKKTDSSTNKVTINPVGTTIDGLPSSIVLTFQNKAVVLQLGQSSWRIISDYNSLGQYFSLGQEFQQAIKTNIGTTYVDIYTGTFVEEGLFTVNLSPNSQIKMIWNWDYVGTGQHQVRIINGATNEVLIESTTFTSDCNPCITAWTNVPSWVNDNPEEITLRWQGKSTVATDDPVAYGIKLMGR